MSISVPFKWALVGLGAGVGLLGFLGIAYVSEKQRKHKEREKRRVLNRILNEFGSHQGDIIKHIQRQEWNSFSTDKLTKVYEHFQRFCASPAHGILGRREFAAIHAKLGIKDEKVIESLFRFWDLNADGNVDFYELVEGLNLFCFGSKAHKLQRLFRVYDLDDNGFITKTELKQLFNAFYESHDHKLVDEAVRRVFVAVDSNHDARLSYKEFLSLSAHPDFEFSAHHGFTLRFIKLFGLAESDLSSGGGTAVE